MPSSASRAVPEDLRPPRNSISHQNVRTETILESITVLRRNASSLVIFGHKGGPGNDLSLPARLS